jgi:hypothetical protein
MLLPVSTATTSLLLKRELLPVTSTVLLEDLEEPICALPLKTIPPLLITMLLPLPL